MFSKKEFAIYNNLRFISMTNFMFSCVAHEKSFITSKPDWVNAQADMNLCWAHMCEGMFSDVAAQIKPTILEFTVYVIWSAELFIYLNRMLHHILYH